MIRSFPVSSDLISFSDQHISGVSGARMMVMEIRPQFRRLDAGHNQLGDNGAVALFEGIAAQRRHFSKNSGAELWGMTSINLAHNGVGDQGINAAAYYISKDLAMRELLMQSNNITLDKVAGLVVERLNASHLNKLSLTTNPLNDDAVSQMFSLLNAPYLRELHMSSGTLTPLVVPALCEYIRSPRSQHLQMLSLNDNALGRKGVTAILDAIEEANFSISRIGLHANAIPIPPSNGNGGGGVPGAVDWNDGVDWDADDPTAPGPPSPPPTAAKTPPDPEDYEPPDSHPDSLMSQVEKRVPQLQKRNGKLTLRVQEAAWRCLAPTRIILHAREPTPEETATRVLDSVTPEMAPATRPPPGVFPLLELPPEVQLLIARHASRDYGALSDAQWARIRAHAGDRASLRKMAARFRKVQETTDGKIGQKYKEWGELEEWLREMGCENWELEEKGFWRRLSDSTSDGVERNAAGVRKI